MKYVPPLGASDTDADFVDADPVSGIEGSTIPAAAIEHPQREIVAVIVAADLTPDANNLTQLPDAINLLATDRSNELIAAHSSVAASDSVAGHVELATAAEARAGTDARRAVTPAGLASAINALITAHSSVATGSSVAGHVELATAAEARAGTDARRAVTPAGLASAINALITAHSSVAAGSSVAGHVELATAAEARAGTDARRAVTPAGLASAINALITAHSSVAASDSVVGHVELATAAEVQAGTDNSKAVTPAGLESILAALLPVGTVITRPVAAVPDGYLECNGAALNKATYPELFAVLGGLYGETTTTFNIPDYRGEFPRGWDSGRGIDVGRAIGTFQQSTVPHHMFAFGGNWGADHDTEQIVNTAVSRSKHEHRNTISYTKYERGIRPRNMSVMFCIKY